jgi:hypothetical protein
MARPPKKEEIIVERHTLEALVIYEVTSHELEQMERETLSVSEDFSFALAGLSIGITIALVLFTVTIESQKVFDVFLILMILGFLVSLYCGIKWARGRQSFTHVVKRIKTRVGSLGEEGKEIDPQQLESLPPAEADKP